MIRIAIGLLSSGMLLASSNTQAQDNAAGVPTPSPTAEANAPAVPVGEVLLKVRAKGSGDSIPRAEIKMNDNVSFTDPKGEVKIVIPPEGDGKVRIFRTGYETLEVPFAQLRPPGEFDIFLYPALTDSNTVIVTGQRRPQVSRKTVSVEESRKIAPSGDPAQVVKLLPGVQTGSFGADVIVRGSGPRDSRYFIDDLEVPFIFHGVGNLSVIPPALMSEVQFDAGGFGPEYGNATGGVIVIRTKNDIPEKPQTEFVANIPFYSGIFHTRPLSENSSMSIAVRRSYVDFFIKQALEAQEEETGGSITLVPYFGDFHGVYLKKNETGHTKYSLLSAYDGVKAAVPTDSFANEDGRASIEFETAFVNLGVEKMSRINRDWKYITTPQIFYFRTNADFVGNAFGLDVTNVRVPTEFSRRLSKNEEFVVGIDPVVGRADINFDAIEFRSDDPTFDPEDANRMKVSRKYPYHALSGWTSVDKQIGDAIVTPGVRAFYDSLIKKSSADPRIRARYALTENNTLKSAVGQFSQSPSPQVANDEFGNADLDFIKSTHYVLGLETKWGDEWTTEFQLFYKTARDVIAQDSEKRYDNDGSFRSQGAEIFIRRNLTNRLFGWLSYTYSRTEERDSDRDPFRESTYDQTHVVNAVASYKLTAQWELGTRYNHHTGDTYTPVSDSVYNVNLDKYQRRDLDDEKNSSRLPNYNALTLYLNKDFLFNTWKMAIKGGMEAYWPKPQVMGMSYNYDYSKEEEQRGLTAIPFFEVRGEL